MGTFQFRNGYLYVNNGNQEIIAGVYKMFDEINCLEKAVETYLSDCKKFKCIPYSEYTETEIAIEKAINGYKVMEHDGGDFNAEDIQKIAHWAGCQATEIEKFIKKYAKASEKEKYSTGAEVTSEDEETPKLITYGEDKALHLADELDDDGKLYVSMKLDVNLMMIDYEVENMSILEDKAVSTLISEKDAIQIIEHLQSAFHLT